MYSMQIIKLNDADSIPTLIYRDSDICLMADIKHALVELYYHLGYHIGNVVDREISIFDKDNNYVETLRIIEEESE